MTRRVCVTAVLMAVFVGSQALAQPMYGSGGWGLRGSYQRMYNPATVETVSGEVQSVDRVMPMKGMRAGVHLQLRTGSETVTVHLGPSWFVEHLDGQIEKGDKIEVKGSRITLNKKPAIIASEVKKGNNLLVLRDSMGVPAWSGWKR